MNQNIEKTKVKSGKILPLMETFTTIQGEGFHSSWKTRQRVVFDSVGRVLNQGGSVVACTNSF